MVARRAGVRRCDTFLTLLRRSAARAFGPRHPVRSKVSQIRRSAASDRWMCRHYNRAMMPKGRVVNTYTAIVERCPDTGLYVGYVPGFPGAHSQGETLEELNSNLKEVIALILEEGAPAIVGEFVGTQTVVLA